MIPHPATFGRYSIDVMIDDELNFQFIEVVDVPGTSAEEKAFHYPEFKAMVDMEHALLLGNIELFDQIIDGSEYEWIYDERKVGTDRWHGILDEECL